jgi:hypothetical protein
MMQKFGSNTSEKEAKNSKIIPKMLTMRKDEKRNEKKQSETKRNEAKILFICFAKMMRNGLCFASISHEAKKKIQAKKGHPSCVSEVSNDVNLSFL